MACGLLPHTQTAMITGGDIAYHDYEGLATDLDERERLVRDIGDKHVMLLRNHGTLAVGSSIGACFLRLYFLERACEAQVLMLAAGRDGLNDPNEGVDAKVAGQVRPEALDGMAGKLAWPALLRKVERLDPGFRQ